MKVGIITIFAVPNYGAMLQAHGLSSHLRSQGIDAALVNYRQPDLEAYFRFKFRLPPAVNHWRRLRNCDRFVEESLRKNGPEVRSVEEFAPEVGGYDAFITGSDQVWFTGPVQHYDRMFFLDFPAEGKRKISYAASAGGNEDFGPHEGRVRQAIGGFDHLGIRDAHTESLVAPLTDAPLTRTVDPVFLHDFEELLEDGRPSREPYILVFGDFRGDLARVVRDVRSATGLRKVVTLQYPCGEATERRPALGPTEWLNWFQHADFVITSYFHGSVVATKFQRPFVSVPTPGRRQKVQTLLEPLGLGERCFLDTSALESVRDVAGRTINWQSAGERLAQRIESSREFLSLALS